jgi:hypothetical protein
MQIEQNILIQPIKPITLIQQINPNKLKLKKIQPTKIIEFYNNDGFQTPSFSDPNTDYIRMKLLGSHARSKNAYVIFSKSTDYLANYSWYMNKSGYPFSYDLNGITMHKYLFMKQGIDTNSMVIDHINHDRLDNRLENLRLCTQKENSYNRSKSSNSKNQYKGIIKNKDGTFNAVATKDGKRYVLKGFKTEVDAAKAYDMIAEELFGQFAGKNFNEF